MVMQQITTAQQEPNAKQFASMEIAGLYPITHRVTFVMQSVNDKINESHSNMS